MVSSIQGTESGKRALLTPLYVITLFVTLTQGVLLYSITQVTGAVQVMLTVFAALFAFTVAIAFFWLIWNRPWNVFTPTDFKDPRTYIDALLRLRKHSDREYLEQFEISQQRITHTPTYNVVREVNINQVKLRIITTDLSTYPADIIVSSDDYQISHAGGVAKAIVDKAGIGVKYEIELKRVTGIAQGDIVSTSGGALPCRTILHAIVLDKILGKEKEVWRWPNPETIKTLTYKCLEYAERAAVASIAFPVLGGGTASKTLSPAISLQVMVNTIETWCREQKRERPISISICVYDLQALEGMDLKQPVLPNHERY